MKGDYKDHDQKGNLGGEYDRKHADAEGTDKYKQTTYPEGQPAKGILDGKNFKIKD